MNTQLRKSMWSFKRVWKSALWTFYDLFHSTPILKLKMTIFVTCNCYLDETIPEPIKQPESWVALRVPTKGATCIPPLGSNTGSMHGCIQWLLATTRPVLPHNILGHRALHRNPKCVTGACAWAHGFAHDPQGCGEMVVGWLVRARKQKQVMSMKPQTWNPLEART